MKILSTTKTMSNNKSSLLSQAFLLLKSEQEVSAFLHDILTPEEIGEISNRLDIARRLAEKESYSSIEKNTGYSSTTIARVAKFLKGKVGGYKTVLERLK
jgi:TrpR-related protein YerC/YecD